MILLMVVILGPSNIHLIGRALLAAYLPPLFTVFSAAEVDLHDICHAVTNETAVRDSPSRLALSPKLTSVDLSAWSSSPSGATVPTSTLLRSDSTTSWVMGIDTAILIHARILSAGWLELLGLPIPSTMNSCSTSMSPPLVNVRGVKHKLEEAVTMLADLENVGQIDDKHAAIAALCEDGMECLQKRVVALEKELEFSTLSKKLDVALASRRAAANVISLTREKLAKKEARCREVLNENHIAHDRLLAELGRPPRALSMWEL
ncbi:hypothetical protein R1sor_020105 [Riccia sorocarpa]|uniref:Uncharacterized protein n=1 Tax=Riccia sorocarpa TaxID=122646 RepID=A0ABD3IED6_9MARC